MDVKRQQELLAASVVGLVVAAGLASFGRGAQAAVGDKVPCYGINKCKGAGDCGGKGNACAGKNACKGTGFIKVDKEACLKIQGGRLTPEPAKS